MTGLGTIINVAAILIGTTVGILIKGGLSKRFEDTVTSAIGLCTMFIGISGAVAGMLEVSGIGLETKDTMVMIASLIIGALIGEWIDVEKRLESAGEWCRSKIPGQGAGSDVGTTSGEGGTTGSVSAGANTFVEAFVTSSLIFCVGAMAIVGSLEDGLNHNYSILFAKAVMDGVMSIIFGASLGIGVYFSALPIAVYQGGITLLAGFIRPYLSDAVIGRMSFVGSILIFALGINLLFGKKIKIGNLLPAMFMPLVLQLFL